MLLGATLSTKIFHEYGPRTFSLTAVLWRIAVITEQLLDEFIASGTTGFVDVVKILFSDSLSFHGPDLTFPLQFTFMHLPGNFIILCLKTKTASLKNNLST